MQFFAYERGQTIFAEEALKGRDYRCPECQGRLRVKEGFHRRKHFFHLHPPMHCRQSQKSHVHLAVQKVICASLPSGESLLEKPFPSIQRIADVVWQPKRLIFEVQCSPISLQEVKERMKDYSSIGYRVIWILHKRRFNRTRLSAAEHFLRPSFAFFTSVSSAGQGMIYDQYEEFAHHRRIRKGPPVPIDLQSPPEKRPELPPKKAERSQTLKDFGRFLYYLLLNRLS